MKHTLGTPVENDVEVYYEADETFNTSISKTKSKKYLLTKLKKNTGPMLFRTAAMFISMTLIFSGIIWSFQNERKE